MFTNINALLEQGSEKSKGLGMYYVCMSIKWYSEIVSCLTSGNMVVCVLFWLVLEPHDL